MRGSMLLLIALLTIANTVSGIALVVDLVNSQGIRNAEQLLLTGAAIWLTNVIVLAAVVLGVRPWWPQLARP